MAGSSAHAAEPVIPLRLFRDQSFVICCSVSLIMGVAMFMQVLVLVVQNSAARRDLGSATSSVNFFRQIGSTVGVALIGALFIHRLDLRLATHLPPAAAARVSKQVSSITPQAVTHLPAQVRHDIVTAFATALPPLYAYLVPLLGLACVLALLLKEQPLRTHAHLEGGTPPSAVSASSTVSPAVSASDAGDAAGAGTDRDQELRRRVLPTEPASPVSP